MADQKLVPKKGTHPVARRFPQLTRSYSASWDPFAARPRFRAQCICADSVSRPTHDR